MERERETPWKMRRNWLPWHSVNRYEAEQFLPKPRNQRGKKALIRDAVQNKKSTPAVGDHRRGKQPAICNKTSYTLRKEMNLRSLGGRRTFPVDWTATSQSPADGSSSSPLRTANKFHMEKKTLKMHCRRSNLHFTPANFF